MVICVKCGGVVLSYLIGNNKYNKCKKCGYISFPLKIK